MAIQLPRLPFGLLLQGIVRAPFISGEALLLPTAFHDFDHVEGARLRVTKIPKYEIGPDGQRRKMADPLPDLPSKYEVYVPAVDVARSGAPLAASTRNSKPALALTFCSWPSLITVTRPTVWAAC